MPNRRECYEVPGLPSVDGPPNLAPLATRMDDYLFSGGIAGTSDGRLGSNADEQASLAFANLRSLLDRAGFSPDDVVRVYAWVADLSVRQAILKPYTEMFPAASNRPAVNVVAADLEGGQQVVLEVYAARGGGPRRSIYVPGTEDSPFPSGAVKGNMLCTSTLTGRYPRTGKLPQEPQAQANVIFENLQAVLEEARCHKDSVGHTFTWYSDHAHRDTNNGPFSRMFPIFGDRPCRHSLIRPLPEGEIMEYEAMAEVGGRRQDFFIGTMAHGGIKGVTNSLPVGTRCSKLAFSAGTYGRGPTEAEAFEAVFTNNVSFLKEADLTLDDVAHAFLWYKDDSNLKVINELWQKYFPDPSNRPARHAIKSDLPSQLQFQMEIIAVAP